MLITRADTKNGWEDPLFSELSVALPDHYASATTLEAEGWQD